jgi:UDP-2,3-diacylglucosamine hydrolase
MQTTLFISDLHLGGEQPHSAQLFLRFAQHTAPQAEALYILGDLFEAWAGDDDLEDPFHQRITGALKKLSSGGTRIYLMHGNRDLLMNQELERACGATLLPDPTLIDLYGIPTLLTHGDVLCTDDVAYQAYRRQAHDPAWQRQFLSQPLAARKAFIAELRARSRSEKQTKSHEIMDVNAEAVANFLREHHYPNLIHGHTHRMGHHVLHVDGHTCERWVLGDWDENGNALQCNDQGCRVIRF